MARIRSIKPEFWCDEKLSECSLSARLTFIGLWSFADDEGRMEHQPAKLRMQIYPCGSVSLTKVRELLGELTERSLIRIYKIDGREYLDVPNFTKHQKINRPTPSKLPSFTELPHGVLTEGSPLEGKGREGKGECASSLEGSLADSGLIDGLDSTAWARWVSYRAEIKKPLKPASMPAAKRSLAAFGATQAAVVEQSIAQGWQGLFELKAKPKVNGSAGEWR